MNFALLMLSLLIVTGGVWLLDRFWLGGKRGADSKEPWWVEYSKSFFPVILVVFVLRSFLVEPFKIPSGSMIPTLLVGDYILVSKSSYGVRLPVINAKIINIGSPQHGDVMVFRYPDNPSLDYIKRVVGLPGDRVEYRHKRLSLNGELLEVERLDDFQYSEKGLSYVKAWRFWDKFEPGTSEADIYKPWMTEQFHQGLIREKVKIASIVQEIMDRHAPQLKTSEKGAADLVLPVPG